MIVVALDDIEDSSIAISPDDQDEILDLCVFWHGCVVWLGLRPEYKSKPMWIWITVLLHPLLGKLQLIHQVFKPSTAEVSAAFKPMFVILCQNDETHMRIVFAAPLQPNLVLICACQTAPQLHTRTKQIVSFQKIPAFLGNGEDVPVGVGGVMLYKLVVQQCVQVGDTFCHCSELSGMYPVGKELTLGSNGQFFE